MSVIEKERGTESIDAEALIKEARRLRRRRWTIGVVVAGGLGAILALVIIASNGPSHRTTLPTPPPRATGVGLPYGDTYVPLKSPNALAVGPNGNLFISDDVRHEILERIRNGRFVVVAGDGIAGHSGNDGSAIKAEIEYPGGMAFAPNGTLYFVDRGTGLVEAITPKGIIRAIAGTTSYPKNHLILLNHPTPANQVDLGPNLNDVAVGPNGSVYIASYQVLRLAPNGLVYWVAGTWPVKPPCGIDCSPTPEAAFLYPGSLAFDRDGDLYVSVPNGNQLLEITARGTLETLGNFRGVGAGIAPLVEAPNGTVIGARNFGLFDISGSSVTPVKDFTEDIFSKGKGTFGPTAVAVSSNGTIYSATLSGEGDSVDNAIAKVTPAGKMMLIWQS